MYMLWIKINLDNAKLSTYPVKMILYISIIIFYLFQYSYLIKPTYLPYSLLFFQKWSLKSILIISEMDSQTWANLNLVWYHNQIKFYYNIFFDLPF